VVKIALTVSDGPDNRVSAEKTIQLHDSIKEVGDLARQFLLDFSDSSRSPEFVVRNFSKSSRCEAERDSEFDDVAKNRRYYRIESSSVGAATVTVQFGGRPCPLAPPKDGDACAAIPAAWQSLCLETFSECKIGERPRVEGTDYVAAVFEQSQWRLCSSDFRDRTGIYRPNFIR
jgi:hypothetical protein